MSTLCYAMVRGKVARFTLLDARGAPVEGGTSVVVTSGVSSVQINERSETQSTTLMRSERDDPRLLLRGKTQTMGYSADIDLCGVDPDLISMLTGMPLVTNAAGDHVGNDATLKLPVANFAMEVWSKLAQPVNGYSYGYTLFPRLRGGRVSGFTFGKNSVNFKITGARTYRASKWGIGPYTLRRHAEGWDMVGWDTDGWDTEHGGAVSCLTSAVVPDEEMGFGEDPFGYMPFGGGSWEGGLIHERLGEPVGSHTHWRNFLLDWAPTPLCGARALYDVVDNEFANPSTQTDDVVDGMSAYTSEDILDGGYA